MTEQTDYLDLGTIIHLSNNRLIRIGKEIGSGFTACVYLATIEADGSKPQEVVVKLAKPLEVAQKLVREEGELLRVLSEIGKGYAPRLFASGTINKDQPYIVMELIKTRPAFLQDELRVGDELSTLRIMKEVFEFLDLIHTKLKKAYPDMKPENFFWDEDLNQLRVIDFGGLEDLRLSPEEDYRAQRDTLNAASYFFTELSGSKLRIGWDGLEDFAEPKIEKLNVSLGTRNILKKLLCRVIDFRLNIASQASAGVEAIINLWNWESEKLTESIKKNLDLARQKQETNMSITSQAAERALEALDIYRIRFSKDSDKDLITSFWDQATNLAICSSQLESGKKFLKAKSKSLAKNFFLEGKARSNTPAIFRRWLYLIDDFEKIPESDGLTLLVIADEIFKSIDNLNFNTAINEIKELQTKFPNLPGFEYVLSDAKFFDLYEKSTIARNEQEYSKSAELLKSAITELNKLPDQAEIRKYECGEVEHEVIRLLEAAEQKEKTRKILSVSLEVLENTKKRNSFDDYSNLRMVTLQNWANPQVFCAFLDLIDSKISEGKIEEAEYLSFYLDDFFLCEKELSERQKAFKYLFTALEAIRVMNCPKVKKSIIGLKEVIHDNDRANQFINLISDSFMKDENFIPDYELTEFLINDNTFSNNLKIQNYLERIIEKDQLIQASNAKKMLRKVRIILGLADVVQIDWLLMEGALRTTSVQELSNALRESTVITNKANELLQNVSSFQGLPSEMSAEIESLNQAIHEQLKEIKDWQKAINSRQLEMNNDLSQIKTEVALWKDQNGLSKDTSLNKDEGLTQLFSLLDRILIISNSNGSNDELNRILIEIIDLLDSIGLKGWRLLQSQLFMDQLKLDETLSEIDALFNSGKNEQSYKELISIEPLLQITQSGIEIRKKHLAVKMLEKVTKDYEHIIVMADYDSNLLLKIQNISETGIPHKYYVDKGIPAYLLAILKKQRDIVEKKLKYTSSKFWLSNNQHGLDEFRVSIEKWLNIESTLKRI